MLNLVADELDIEAEIVADFVLPGSALQVTKDFVVEHCIKRKILKWLFMLTADRLQELFDRYSSIQGNPIPNRYRTLRIFW